MPALTVGGNTIPITLQGGHEESLVSLVESDRSGSGQLRTGHTVESPRPSRFPWRTALLDASTKSTLVTELQSLRVTIAGDLPGSSYDHIVLRWSLEPMHGDTEYWRAAFETVEADPT